MIVNEKHMIKLSQLLGLEWDGGNDTRLFNESVWDFNLVEMGRKKYNEMENFINSFSIDNDSFSVYAWNDSGGFDYWIKNNGINYLQITVSITNTKRALNQVPVIQKSINKYWDIIIKKYAKYEVRSCGFPTNEEINDYILTEKQINSKLFPLLTGVNENEYNAKW